MIRELLKRAGEGEPLWLPMLREEFSHTVGARKTVVRLKGDDGFVCDREICFPPAVDSDERAFLLRYAAANVYNLLSAYSAREVILFCDRETEGLLADLPGLFDAKSGYGKVKNIAQRIFGSFSVSFIPIERYCPPKTQDGAVKTDLGTTLRTLCAAADGKCCVGADVGGSDIKLAVSTYGKLLYTKEYDWNPSLSPTAEGVIEPNMGLIKEARERIREQGGELDAVGISFPDIVIGDRIVGGETPKTKGMRDNPAIDYEREFGKIRDLKERVLSLCAPGGTVHLTNDGNMAAFTAAMELAAGGRDELIREGVVAHSLGTDLGTGWLRADGTIPEFPLELYDLLLDLGDERSAALPPEDFRSTRNENSGMNGVRRYLGQAAAYRLAWKRDPSMLDGFVSQDGGILYIPTSPVDLRKPCLEHLMVLATEGREEAEEVFREIGENLSVVTKEMNWIFGMTP